MAIHMSPANDILPAAKVRVKLKQMESLLYYEFYHLFCSILIKIVNMLKKSDHHLQLQSLPHQFDDFKTDCCVNQYQQINSASAHWSIDIVKLYDQSHVIVANKQATLSSSVLKFKSAGEEQTRIIINAYYYCFYQKLYVGLSFIEKKKSNSEIMLEYWRIASVCGQSKSRLRLYIVFGCTSIIKQCWFSVSFRYNTICLRQLAIQQMTKLKYLPILTHCMSICNTPKKKAFTFACWKC